MGAVVLTASGFHSAKWKNISVHCHVAACRVLSDGRLTESRELLDWKWQQRMLAVMCAKISSWLVRPYPSLSFLVHDIAGEHNLLASKHALIANKCARWSPDQPDRLRRPGNINH
eukprot:scpid88583/ scgid19356/ 